MTPRGRHTVTSGTRRGTAAFGALLIGAAVVLLVIPTSSQSAQAATDASSALTKTGTGAFSGLSVTVDRTRNLINEVVRVHWSGGVPTRDGGTLMNTGYLQLMQCWGDSPSGPDRTQCVYGGLINTDKRGGELTNSRRLDYSAAVVDPLETYTVGKPSPVFLPFKSVTGDEVTGNINQFFDAYTTNEIDYAQTGADGTGEAYMEMLTSRESAGLGCGAATSSGPRKCWLVVVPRNDKEVDGSTTIKLATSPLSQTNWNNRLTFPMSFAATGETCPLGSAERRSIGSESLVEAVGSWQPALCATSSARVYGYSVTPDSVARRQVTSTDPQMAFLNGPVPASQVAPSRPLVYAPVTLSALTLSFLIESQAGPNAPPELKQRDGQRITELNLTPRLLAKLLTQSYRQAIVDGGAGYIAGNPADMFADPEFLALNPSFKDLKYGRGISDIAVPLGLADLNRELWAYVASDPSAVNFLNGQPDPWGMRVNPSYQSIAVPLDEFPKSDPLCLTFTTGPGPLCTQDFRAYSADMHDAARAVGRGDAQARTEWDPTSTPPQYKKTPPLAPGNRALMAFADTATATRYGLTPAHLLNAAGQFVAPTTSSILAGYTAMSTTEVPGVKEANPLSLDPAAYPLVTMTYAVTAPQALTSVQATDYANLVRYAVSTGQVPGIEVGQLPLGYVPLPAAERARALAVAGVIAAGPQPTASPTPSSSATATGDGGSSVPSTEPATAPSEQSSAPTESPSASALAPDSGSSSAPALTPVAAATPATPAGSGRLSIVVALILGGAAALLGPVLPWLSRPSGG